MLKIEPTTHLSIGTNINAYGFWVGNGEGNILFGALNPLRSS